MRSMIIANVTPRSRALRSSVRVLACAVFLLGVFVLGGGSAAAATAAAGFSIHSFATPTDFSTADDAACSFRRNEQGGPSCDSYEVTAKNVGSEPTDGSAVVLTDALPAGLTVKGISFFWFGASGEAEAGAKDLGESYCSEAPVECHLPVVLAPDQTLEMIVYVMVDPGAEGALVNTATVSGGGAPEAATSEQTQVGATPVFGFADLGTLTAGLDGAPETQAGAHPYEFTATIDLNTENRFPASDTVKLAPTSVRDVKDIVVDLPLGFLGSALAAPTCTLAQLSSLAHCPPATRLGYIKSAPNGVESPAVGGGLISVNGPLYNIAPERGVVSEFGYYDSNFGSHVLYSSVAPTPAGYVLRTISHDIPQVTLTSIHLALYGDPAARDESGNTPVALFTNPADCSGEPLVTTAHMDSWQDPGRYNPDGTPDFSDPNWAVGTSESPPVTGCEELRFDPSLSAQPETTTADSPTGLDVALRVPQSEAPGTLATPPLRNATVTLPAGLTLNPAAATGLGACTEGEIDLAGAGAPSCPESSKIGTVELTTPLLAGTLQGSIYLATQNENPFHSLLAGYIVIDDATTGLVLKIPGDLTPNPQTGQITGVFDNNPQFPFSDLHLRFFGGPRGELATPEGCGTYTTTSDLMPWSAPDSGPDATPSDSFQVTSGCVSAFAPSFTAGTENPQAGGYAPFTLTLSRTDGEQSLAGVSVTLPPGLLGKLAGIPLCPDEQANTGTCPEASQVGTVSVGAGVGPDPVFVGGKAYLTGPYNGGPYGLAVEVPAVAGPFNLGMVVVRQSLRIDPNTAQVTDVSDPFPTILDGIPLRVRTVSVTLDRPGFTFNPTNCTPMSVIGVLTSTDGVTANVSSRFQAGGCRELPFAPKFTVSTQAQTSKHNGASLTVKGSFPAGEANIHSVAVTLPKQLPARLTTIQQACTLAVFNTNPASCPAGSDIGVVTATTPILTTPLTGPAYLVSHGGAAFPDIVVILQGAGVTVELAGSIDIKHNITSSTFAAVPDAPIASFQLTLPEGPHSGLAAVVPAKAKGSLCGQSLAMPFTITGQNGAVVKENNKIAVTGCPRAKKKGKPKHSKKAGKKK